MLSALLVLGLALYFVYIFRQSIGAVTKKVKGVKVVLMSLSLLVMTLVLFLQSYIPVEVWCLPSILLILALLSEFISFLRMRGR